MEIKFDETLHKYTVDGKEVISVTQLLQKHKITPSYDAVDKELLRVASERGTLIHEEVEKSIESGECGFTEEDEELFLSTYFEGEVEERYKTKILIFKICQDFLWSIWTNIKEAEGDDFGDYGITRYNRAKSNLNKILK